MQLSATAQSGHTGGATADANGTDVGTLDDADLLTAAVDGARVEAVFRELYRRYHRPLFTFLQRRLGDRAAAEEALQETFVRLWRAAADYDPARGAVAALLFTIGRNVATDTQRRTARRPAGDSLPAAWDSLAAVTGDDRTEVGLTVAAAMSRLPAPHREVLDLAYWGDLSQTQIADVLRIPLGTVKSRAFLALKGLRAELVAVGLMA